MLAISHLLVLPSAFGYGVGTLIFENYAAQYPARMCPYQRFACSLATDHAYDSGPVWVAGPSPYGSFIRTSTPVYPGAHPNISSIQTSTMITSSNSLHRERMPIQVQNAKESRLARQFRSNIWKPYRLNGIDLNLAFPYTVRRLYSNVGTHPDSHAASDFSATYSLAKSFSEHHE